MSTLEHHDRPQLTLKLIESSGAVLIEGQGLSRSVWDEVSLALDRTGRSENWMLVVPVQRIISKRRILRGVLARNNVSLTADESVRSLLTNSMQDEVEAAQALKDSPEATSRSPGSIALPDGFQGWRFNRSLKDFQTRDLSRLQGMRHGANFSVPGAGKTTVALALHQTLHDSDRVDRLLVVAPLSAFAAWEGETKLCFDSPPSVGRFRDGEIPETDIVLINYQRLPAAFEQLGSWMCRYRVHLIIDEAHQAKRGVLGEWGRVLTNLSPLAARRDILTGTPAPNHPRDLAALLDILWPGRSVSHAIPKAALSQDPPLNAMTEINNAIRPLYVRTTKEELSLPKVSVDVVPVKIGALQQAVYDALLNRYSGMLDLDRRDSVFFAQVGEVVIHLIQAACSPQLLSAQTSTSVYKASPIPVPAGSRLAKLIDAYADHEVPAKIAHACKIVRDNALLGRKTLLWSNFPDNLLTLEQQLASLKPALVYGAIPSREDDADEGLRTREKELARFRSSEDCFVLLANPAAMAEGVSLHQVCHDAVYVDRTFNAGQYLQSLDRIHRLGLAPGVETRVTVLLAEGTIDTRVNSRVENKARRLSTMLADPGLVKMALPDHDDYGAPLDDPEDLEEILLYLRDAPSFDHE